MTTGKLDGTRREFTASVNGTDLRVEEVGAGTETVVFASALFTNRGMFETPIDALRGDHRCISYDHRGQGDSCFGVPQPSTHLLGAEGLYDDAVALLDHLQVDRCHWVGASIGGMVGMRLAARQPERVRSLILIGPSLRPAPKAARVQVDLMGLLVRISHAFGPVGTAVRRRVSEQVMGNLFGPTFMADPARAEDRERWRQHFAAQLVPAALPMLREVFRYPATGPELLACIQAPTLVLVGEEEYGGTEEAQAAQRAIPGARLQTIPGAGHMVLVEQPHVGTAAITGFIRGVEAA